MSLKQFEWENVGYYETPAILNIKLRICTVPFLRGKMYYNNNCSLNLQKGNSLKITRHRKDWRNYPRHYLLKLSFPIHNFFFCNRKQFSLICLSATWKHLTIKIFQMIFQMNPEIPSYVWKVIEGLLPEGKTTVRIRHRDYISASIKRKFTSCSSAGLYAKHSVLAITAANKCRFWNICINYTQEQLQYIKGSIWTSWIDWMKTDDMCLAALQAKLSTDKHRQTPLVWKEIESSLPGLN